MLIRRPPDIRSSDLTSESLYLGRREWLRAAGVMAAGIALPKPGRGDSTRRDDDKPTPYDVVTTYNNYYEFGTGKDEPAQYAGTLRLKPWTITIDGDVKRPGTFPLEDVLKGLPVVDRVYRMRCVEAWSMVIPWNGIVLGDLIKKLEPGSKARFIEFTTLHDPKQMPGQSSTILDWPYVEALRLDEAMHPLALLSTGIYGKPLLGQNGGPIRLTVPGKYGFKGGKSIVRIRFTDVMPKTTWSIAWPEAYGFYANVNPAVAHPRYSQKTERRVGDYFKRPTLMFNGYADQVASLYSGMDLRVNY
jgi:sulfoxide reductase catalytic subunit YedY